MFAYYNLLRENAKIEDINVPEIIDECKTTSNHKTALVCLYSLLFRDYNRKVKAVKSKRVKDAPKQKIPTREECLLDKIAEIDLVRGRLVLGLFMSNKMNIVARKGLIAKIIKNDLKLADIKTAILKSEKFEGDIEDVVFKNLLVDTLIELSDITREVNLSRLAHQMDTDMYLAKIKTDPSLSNLAPFDPLISKYVNTCIAPNIKDSERIKINNQIKINKTDTINAILNEVIRNDTCSTVSYDCFYGPSQFSRDLRVSAIVEDGKRFKVILYHDCLYDVLGYSLKLEDGVIHKLFDDMSWPQRLEQLKYRTSIRLDKRDTLPTATDGDVAIDWIEDGFSNHAMYSKGKKI